MKTHSIKSIGGLFITLLLLYIATGCDSNDEVEGRVQVLLTDAPLDDVLEANISILRVELIDSTGRETIALDKPLSFDLLTLRDGVTAELADLPVLASTYSQLRLVVSDSAYVLLDDSTMQELKIPSGETSGIKLMDIPPININDGDDLVVITIDFDAEASFVKAGNSGKYIFKPVLKPLSIEINGEMSMVPDDSTGTGG
ncbi:MAG: DUF4382 domain-containing protein [Rhodothermales bacterium]